MQSGKGLPRSKRNAPGRERGAVYIVTLFVLAGLVLLVAALAAATREASRAQWNRMEERRARLMLDSGVQRAIAELQRQDLKKTTLSDGWATLGDAGATAFTVGSDSFQIQILDTGARINVNTADADVLKRLPMTSQQVDSLLDWREASQSPRPEGAKDEYYNRLATPYNTKLKTLDSVDELLLVRGFTPEALTKPAPFNRSGTVNSAVLEDLITVDSTSHDKDLAGQPKLNINSASVDQLVSIGVPQSLANAILQPGHPNYTDLGDVLKVPMMTTEAAKALLDYVAVTDDGPRQGLIDLNTAPAEVLSAIPEVNDDVAASIVARQSTGFRSLGDLVDLPGMDLPVLAATVDRFCVESRAFIVRVVGAAGSTRLAAEAVVLVEDDGDARMVRMQPKPYREARTRWGWPENPTQQTALGVAE